MVVGQKQGEVNRTSLMSLLMANNKIAGFSGAQSGKLGLDVALEALRDCRRQRKCTNDELWHYAKICRVANVMRPYLEAVSA